METQKKLEAQKKLCQERKEQLRAERERLAVQVCFLILHFFFNQYFFIRKQNSSNNKMNMHKSHQHNTKLLWKQLKVKMMPNIEEEEKK